MATWLQAEVRLDGLGCYLAAQFCSCRPCIFEVILQEMQVAAVSPDSLIFNACVGACRRGSQGHLALQLEAKKTESGLYPSWFGANLA